MHHSLTLTFCACRTQDTFLTVEQLQTDGSWKVMLVDGDWDTRMYWEEVWLIQSRITITWQIAADTAPGTHSLLPPSLLSSFLCFAAADDLLLLLPARETNVQASTASGPSASPRTSWATLPPTRAPPAPSRSRKGEARSSPHLPLPRRRDRLPDTVHHHCHLLPVAAFAVGLPSCRPRNRWRNEGNI